jgi:hypothetical protein
MPALIVLGSMWEACYASYAAGLAADDGIGAALCNHRVRFVLGGYEAAGDVACSDTKVSPAASRLIAQPIVEDRKN